MPRGSADAWPQATIDRALGLWKSGLSARQIGLVMGRTKGSIIGKLWRLDARRPAPTLPSKRPKCASQRHQPNRNRIKGARIGARNAMKPEPPPLVPSLNVPFIENKGCKAITDSTRYAQRCCGHPTDAGGVYCEAHAALHHQPGKGKAR